MKNNSTVTFGKPTPGVPDVPDVRASIDAERRAFGLPPLAPATDTAPGSAQPTRAEIAAALATIERVQISLAETARRFAGWLAAGEDEG